MEVFAGHLQPIHHPWIPAFAGMTNWGEILREPPIFVPIAPLVPPLPPLDSGFRRNDEGKPRNIIFVPMTKLGRRDHREPLTLQGPSILLPMTIVGGGMSQERRY